MFYIMFRKMDWMVRILTFSYNVSSKYDLQATFLGTFKFLNRFWHVACIGCLRCTCFIEYFYSFGVVKKEYI